MKKTLLITMALLLVWGATALATEQGRGFTLGTSLPLGIGEEVQFYVGWDTLGTPWVVTLAKADITDWTGIYTLGMFYEWRFGDNSNLRGGFGTDWDLDGGGIVLDALRVSGGIFLFLDDYLAIGILGNYDGDFFPSLSLEVYPGLIGSGATGE